MFSLEIGFQDGESQSEMLLVRRPQAVIGAADSAHVMIEDMKVLDYQIKIIKDFGRGFFCKAISNDPSKAVRDVADGVVDGQLSLDLGNLQLTITSLDPDLAVKADEPPDRAGVRILRLACKMETPEFPAVAVMGDSPMVVSFPADQPIYIGRSNKCAVRLDTPSISGKHARIGFENGKFWVEDLGSTNGTFVNGQQISGRMTIDPCTSIVLGEQTVLYGILSYEDYAQIANAANDPLPQQDSRRYPILFSLSEVARPARFVLPIGSSVRIGRDPSSDMWLGAPHISRHHCEVFLQESGIITVEDFSTNGTAYNGGILHRGRVLEIDNEPKVLNFGGSLTVAICFNEEQEEKFRKMKGGVESFDENIRPPIAHEEKRRSLTEVPPASTYEASTAKEVVSAVHSKPSARSYVQRLRVAFESKSVKEQYIIILASFLGLVVLVFITVFFLNTQLL